MWLSYRCFSARSEESVPVFGTLGEHTQDQFVQFERIVFNFPQLDLPGADCPGVIQHMLQFIKVHQSAFDLIKVHLPDFGTAGDVSDKPTECIM